MPAETIWVNETGHTVGVAHGVFGPPATVPPGTVGVRRKSDNADFSSWAVGVTGALVEIFIPPSDATLMTAVNPYTYTDDFWVLVGVTSGGVDDTLFSDFTGIAQASSIGLYALDNDPGSGDDTSYCDEGFFRVHLEPTPTSTNGAITGYTVRIWPVGGPAGDIIYDDTDPEFEWTPPDGIYVDHYLECTTHYGSFDFVAPVIEGEGEDLIPACPLCDRKTRGNISIF